MSPTARCSATSATRSATTTSGSWSGASCWTRCRELFGDETADYQGEIDRHYAEGPPEGWESSYISSYATMHPFEDFAETWAHYLHICDTIETASEYGLTTVGTVTSFTTSVTSSSGSGCRSVSR